MLLTISQFNPMFEGGDWFNNQPHPQDIQIKVVSGLVTNHIHKDLKMLQSHQVSNSQGFRFESNENILLHKSINLSSSCYFS